MLLTFAGGVSRCMVGPYFCAVWPFFFSSFFFFVDRAVHDVPPRKRYRQSFSARRAYSGINDHYYYTEDTFEGGDGALIYKELSFVFSIEIFRVSLVTFFHASKV